MTALRYVVADVFTDVPLAGNQLAVFTDGRTLDTEIMQALALEVGFSETVFVLPPEGDGDVRIRIFTPRNELPFAGHPTLGTAFVLGGPLQRSTITIETARGDVPVTLERDDSGRIVFGRMVQPVPEVAPFANTEPLFAALGVAGSELPVERYDNGAEHLFVALQSEEAVAGLRPDLRALERFGVAGVNCFAGSGAALEDKDVLAARRCRRGCRDRICGRAARMSSGTARTHRVGAGDRRHAGRRDRSPIDPRRTRRRAGRVDPRSRGRRRGRDRRARRVPPLRRGPRISPRRPR